MLEFLSTNLLWWHWIAFGLVLLILEIFSGTFLMLGLGVAAIIVGVIEVLFPLNLEMQLTIWLVLSVLAIALWFKYMRDNRVEQTGQSNYTLETKGTVTKTIEPNSRGEVKFDLPVLGNTTWIATSKEELPINTRVKIIEVKGQLIEVASL